MSTIHLVPNDLLRRYHVKEWRNATGILSTACPKEWSELQDVLRQFKLLKSEVRIAGGNRSLISRRIDEPLYAKGWVERNSKLLSASTRVPSTVRHTPLIVLRAGSPLKWNGTTKIRSLIAT